jgi:hypothetical protein
LEPLRFKPPAPADLEFSVSTVAPRDFERSSFTGAASRLVIGSVPALSFNRLGRIAVFSNGITLQSKLGLTYMGLSRSTVTSFENVSEGSGQQDLNIFMLRAGVEASWKDLLPWGFEPNVSVSVLPSWATAQESVYEHSLSATGLPYEGTLGFVWRSAHDQGLGGLSLGVAGEAMGGRIGSSSMAGIGVEGLMRIAL